MSKGSWYRPVNKKKYDESYDRIFGEKQDVGNNRSNESGLGEEETNNDMVQGSNETGIS